jgi:hypothetical protein
VGSSQAAANSAAKVGERELTTSGVGQATSKAEESAPKADALREQYLGRTPGKSSRTGRQVVQRMKDEGNLRFTANGAAEVRYVDPVTKAESWHLIETTDMGHIEAAVTYWNRTGRYFGPKHPEVRKHMRDPAYYELQPSSVNRSNGAKMRERYMPPANQE